jgi:hypothetical protein
MHVRGEKVDEVLREVDEKGMQAVVEKYVCLLASQSAEIDFQIEVHQQT